MEEQNLKLQSMKTDIERKQSEINRNIPEEEHLKSETALNLASAAEKASKVDVGTKIQ